MGLKLGMKILKGVTMSVFKTFLNLCIEFLERISSSIKTTVVLVCTYIGQMSSEEWINFLSIAVLIAQLIYLIRKHCKLSDKES